MRLYHLSEGEWFVRGTDDIDEATKFLLEDPEVAEYDDGIAEDCDLEPHVTVEWNGWARFVPCKCGEHSWHVVPQRTGPAQGTFKGVFFDRVVFEEIVYEMDYEDAS